MPRVAHLTILLSAILACLLLTGCREGKLNLRRAEDLCTAWLHSLDGFLNPQPKPPPEPRQMENADGPDGAGEDAEAQGEEGAQEPGLGQPQCLRDCFVDDGWLPEGFKNPTEAIAWLTASRRIIGKVQSIDLAEGGAQITFEVMGNAPTVLTALIVRENSAPKCKRLQQAQTAEAAATEGATRSVEGSGAPRTDTTSAKSRAGAQTTSAPAKAPKSGQTASQAARP